MLPQESTYPTGIDKFTPESHVSSSVSTIYLFGSVFGSKGQRLRPLIKKRSTIKFFMIVTTLRT